MMLTVLPGPEIIFRPVHEKSSANSGKKGPKKKLLQPLFCNIWPKFSHKFFRPTFFSPASNELFGRNFGHLAKLAAAQPPSPHFPSLPSLSPLPSLAALQLTAQLAKY
jgi:hypothetical protein